MKIDFILNRKDVKVDCPPEKRLIDVIREDFKLMMTKNSCYRGECGSCIVQIEGAPVPACQVPIFSIRNKQILTIEGFSGTEKYLDIITAFKEANCMPCPFCFAGKVFSVDSLIDGRRSPSTTEIMSLLSEHPCECTPTSRFIEGVKIAYQNREIRGELLK
ncbi:MAG: 2Fe-2S iron-sulfur cluster-binding protein [Spirochaetales bacterium]|nr:2Fe-2S iron-sulfur cluster-binding protein [Spirochaetales bacterium]